MALRCTHIQMVDESKSDPAQDIFRDKSGVPREDEEPAGPPPR